MYLTSFFIFTVSVLVYLYMTFRQAASHPFIPSGPGDSRGPCPMLNTLANHGYLPRDGRNITIENMADAILAGTNWSREFGLFAGPIVFGLLGDPAAIDLEDLHNRAAGVERPASLTRVGENRTVSLARVASIMDDSVDPQYINTASMGITRRRLESLEPLTPEQSGNARLEAAMVLMLAVDGEVPPATGENIDVKKLKAFKDRASAILTEERFPRELGWRPSVREVQLADVNPLIAAIAEAQNSS